MLDNTIGRAPDCVLCGLHRDAAVHLRPAPDGHKYTDEPLQTLSFIDYRNGKRMDIEGKTSTIKRISDLMHHYDLMQQALSELSQTAIPNELSNEQLRNIVREHKALAAATLQEYPLTFQMTA